MRAVVQRVSSAGVEVGGEIVGRINRGLLIYLGVGKGDGLKDAEFIAGKIVGLRIFPDAADKMNRSVVDVSGGVLIVSQFTLQGDCRKGRRPGFDKAAEPELAERLYEKTVELVRAKGVEVATGQFRKHMLVSSVNDGPATFLLESCS